MENFAAQTGVPKARDESARGGRERALKTSNFHHWALFLFFLTWHKSDRACWETRDTLPRMTKLASITPHTHTHISYKEKGYRGCQGRRKRNKMGYRNIAKHLTAAERPGRGFSPTGAKRQMGSITAPSDHTHTHKNSVSIKRTQRRANRTGGETKRTEKWAGRSKKKKKDMSQWFTPDDSSPPRFNLSPDNFSVRAEWIIIHRLVNRVFAKQKWSKI